MKFLIISIILTLLITASDQRVSFYCQFINVGERHWTEIETPQIIWHYTCIVQSMTFGNTSEELVSVVGYHSNDRTNMNVTGLTIADQDCPSIPWNIDNFFPNLEMISFENTSLIRISPVSLMFFPRLKGFRSTFNPIETLNATIFDNNLQLQYLTFNDNELKNAGRNLFQRTLKLNRANFMNNTCISFLATNLDEVAEFKSKLVEHCPPPVGSLECPIAEEIELCEDELKTMVNGWQENGNSSHLLLKIDQLSEELQETRHELSVIKAELEDYKAKMIESKQEIANILRLITSNNVDNNKNDDR